MKVVVTGAAGHIGLNIVHVLHQKGFDVLANNLNEEKLASMQLPEVDWIHGNVLDLAFLEKAFDGADVVVNLAARISIDGDPNGDVMRINVQGPANVAEACLKNKVKRLIHFSSIHAFKYTAKDPVVNEQTARADETSFKYDQSKIGGERAVLKAVEKGLEVIILNPTAVLGPFNYWSSFTGQLLKDLYLGRIPALTRSAFDWVDARDLAEATVSAITKGRSGENYILSGQGADLRTIAQWVHEFGGKKTTSGNGRVWFSELWNSFFESIQ